MDVSLRSDFKWFHMNRFFQRVYGVLEFNPSYVALFAQRLVSLEGVRGCSPGERVLRYESVTELPQMLHYLM
jgi:hypothetical protein